MIGLTLDILLNHLPNNSIRSSHNNGIAIKSGPMTQSQGDNKLGPKDMGLRRKATKLLMGVEHSMGCHAKSWDYRDTCSIDCKSLFGNFFCQIMFGGDLYLGGAK